MIVHPDLAWPEFKVALEYDGQWHDAALSSTAIETGCGGSRPPAGSSFR